MRRIALATLTLGLAVASPASADFYTGREIKKFCDNKSPIMLGYLAGWTDKWNRDTNMLADAYTAQKVPAARRIILPQLQKATEGICVPYGANLGEMLKLLCTYIDKHPDKISLAASDLIATSVGGAWTCEADE